MSASVVLVVFATQSGSTAGIAEAIACELRDAGFAVECRPASEIDDLAPYGALVLGSGVYVRSRSSDGGGFLARHAAWVAARPVWLFCSGPIGRGPAHDAGVSVEGAVMDVARTIGARGAAAFGEPGVAEDSGVDAIGRPIDLPRVRSWAHEIAAELGWTPVAAASQRVLEGRTPANFARPARL
jgi:menaquinone-dependent protoporphyrinogen oxidase